MRKITRRFALGGAVLIVAGPLLGGGDGLSLLAGMAAVLAPQWLFRRMMSATPAIGRVFSLWGAKFSLTILLLAVTARVLHDFSLPAGAAFLCGVTAAVAINVAAAVDDYRKAAGTNGG